MPAISDGQLVDLVLVVAQHAGVLLHRLLEVAVGSRGEGFGELGVRALEVLDGVVEAGLLLF